jgi:hypothetical protein
MVKFADVAYKSVTAGLGLATLWVGGNLVFNITRGISWHYAQDKVLIFLSLFLIPCSVLPSQSAPPTHINLNSLLHLYNMTKVSRS